MKIIKKFVLKFRLQVIIVALLCVLVPVAVSFAMEAISNFNVQKSVNAANDAMDSLYEIENLYRNAIRTAGDRLCDSIETKENEKFPISRADVQSECKKENMSSADVVRVYRGTSDFLME